MTTQILESPAVTLEGGYIMRPATLDDVAGAVAVFNACSRQLLGVEEFNADNYRVEWEIPGLNLETDVRVVVAPDGKVVACMEVWDLLDSHVRVNFFGRVHPDHQGRGLGAALVRWAEARARQAVDKAPEGTRVFMLTGVLDANRDAQGLFRSEGFELVRHHWRMVIEMDVNAPPPAPELPDGIVVRPLRFGQDDRVAIQAVRESFRDHWAYVEPPFEEEIERWQHFMKNDKDFDPSIWFLAWDGGEVAGVSLCWPKTNDDPDMGWVGTLGVRRPWRRKGLGLALLLHSFGEFYRRGRRRVGLGVDAQSLTGATRLYEKAGMRVARVYNTYEKELRPGVDLSTQSVQ
ncbi:MAG TPA: GNAT family N-acetyltransferase [Anaerolineae bacterium]|nr:GNAT family N-acetyltransferase [Anaerolineae bacterium]